jgi:protein O-mannosyl-transferase
MGRLARNLLFTAALFAATLLAYAPAINAGFIWNDSEYVTSPALRSADGLARIWFEVGATEQYYPILHSAFWVEDKLWGDSAAGYHLLNILLHAIAACLVAACLRRLAIPGAALAAFCFALHPVCVESVAWISEQKNTLSLVFYLLAALAYLRFDASRRDAHWLIASGIFVVALLSKSTTATLPPALLVVLWWRRGKLEWSRDVLPLVPWFVLGAAMGLFSAYVEKKYVGAEGAGFTLTLLERSLLAGRVVWFYLGKLIWPADLIFIYPRWTVNAAAPSQWIFLVAVVLVLAGLAVVGRRTRAPLAAALFFGGSLFPVLGFFNVYAFMFSFVADHWQYLPGIGIITLAAAVLTRSLTTASPFIRRGVQGTLVAALALLTFQQSRMYADMRTFYRMTIAKNPQAWMAQNNLGSLLRDDGRFEEAVAHFEAALRAKPDLHKTHNNLASCLRYLNRSQEALDHYRRALALAPDYPEAHNNLGSLLRELGDPMEAIRHLMRAVQLDPEYVDARNNLGIALRETGRLRAAIAQFEQAVRLEPKSAPIHLNLALSYSLAGRDDDAMRHLREARRLNPAIPDITAR